MPDPEDRGWCSDGVYRGTDGGIITPAGTEWAREHYQCLLHSEHLHTEDALLTALSEQDDGLQVPMDVEDALRAWIVNAHEALDDVKKLLDEGHPDRVLRLRQVRSALNEIAGSCHQVSHVTEDCIAHAQHRRGHLS